VLGSEEQRLDDRPRGRGGRRKGRSALRRRDVENKDVFELKRHDLLPPESGRPREADFSTCYLEVVHDSSQELISEPC